MHVAMCVCIHSFLCPFHTASPACSKGMFWPATSY